MNLLQPKKENEDTEKEVNEEEEDFEDDQVLIKIGKFVGDLKKGLKVRTDYLEK